MQASRSILAFVKGSKVSIRSSVLEFRFLALVFGLRQILIARALGARIPRFCHLPVTLAKEGGKISKRKQGLQPPVTFAMSSVEQQQHQQQQPHVVATSTRNASATEAPAAESSASGTPEASSGGKLTDYTIRGLRMRGFHPEAVADCLRGHHLGDMQIRGYVALRSSIHFP